LWKSAIIGDGPSVLTSEKGLTDIQVSPNPFREITKINFSVPEKQKIEVFIVNSLGQKVITLQNSMVNEGEHQLIWDGRNQNGQIVTRGMYFLNIKGIKEKSTLKLIKN
jgi:flagellar hook assembly protein FlgD